MSTTKGHFIRPLVLLVWAALAAGLMAGLLASPARATTYTVSESSASGAGTLSDAIRQANNNAGADTVGFDLGSSATISPLDTEEITDPAGLTIDGGGANITISGERSGSVFSLSFLLANGTPKLTLNRLTVADARAGTFGAGGAVWNDGGTLEVNNSTLSGNSAGVGGAIYNDEGTVTVTNSTITGNSATAGPGGGIYNSGRSTLGTVLVSNSTLSGNSAPPNKGGAIASDPLGSTATTVTLENTIVANSPSGGNCSSNPIFGTIIDGGYNLASDDTCRLNTTNHSLPDVDDPRLGPLQYNGGPTQTYALLEGSPAVNGGNNAFAVDANGNPLPYDQRGEDFARIVGPAVDMGAFEVQGSVGEEPPPSEVPEDRQACKKGGYEEFGFKNQGLCIKAVNHAD